MPAFTNNTWATRSLIDTLTHAHTRSVHTDSKGTTPFLELFSSKCPSAVNQSDAELNNHLLFISQPHGCKDKTKAIHHFYTSVGEQVCLFGHIQY